METTKMRLLRNLVNRRIVNHGKKHITLDDGTKLYLDEEHLELLGLELEANA